MPADLSAVFQHREKHCEHCAASRALLHPSVELWAPGMLELTGMGLSHHLFRSRSCRILGKLGNSVASALVSELDRAITCCTVCGDPGEHSLFPTDAMGRLWAEQALLY